MPKKIITFLSLSIAIFLVLSTVVGVVPAETFESENESRDTVYKLIDKPDDFSRVETNLEVVEEYESFLLVKVDETGKELMSFDSMSVLNSELNKIHLKRETIDINNQASLQDDQEAKDGLYLVQSIGPIKPEWNEELASIGKILEYIPENAYLMDLSSESVEEIEEKDYIRWVGKYETQHRISPRLDDLQGQKDLSLIIYEDVEEVLPELEKFGKIDRYRGDHVRMTSDVSNVEHIAQIEGVGWIELNEEIELLNNDAQWSVQSGVTEERPIWERGLTGEGQIVGVADTGVDYSHSAFRDPKGDPIGPDHRKIVNYVEYAGDYDGHGHGTHVAGSIAGNDEIDDDPQPYDGVAKDARLSVYDIGTDSGGLELPSSLYYIFDAAYEDGARVHSNSWGSDDSSYTSRAREVDEYMWENKDMLILFAAGNSGDEENTMASPATAKNILSVGASGNGNRDSSQNDMASFSSRGPTDDGRLKPEIVAPGQGSQGWYGDDDIISAKSDGDPDSQNNEYTDMQGTSMATPIVAGSAAVVREYFEEGYYPREDIENPSAALIKAVLVNSAEEITGAGAYTNGDSYPNFDQGFGRTTLDNSLEFADNQRNLKVFDEIIGLKTGESDNYTITVENSSEPLEVTMAYTDYPGSPTAEKALVNDLNLKVTAPDGSIFKGNVFEGTDPGQSTTGGEFDNLNPLENVLRIEPQVGEYEIEVIGENIPKERQPYALAITGQIDYEEENGPISADFDHDPVFPMEEETVQFTDQSSSNEGDIVEWSWDFGDGTTSEEQNPDHVYDEYGYYDLTLTVIDETGLEDTEERTLKIEEPEYCEIKGDTSYEYITNVKFNGINRDSGNDGGYADHTDSISDPVVPGETYELSVTMSTSGFSNYATVVFDWSQDYKLSNEEVIEIGYGDNDPQTVTTEITVPEDAQAGETRMRVMQRYNEYHYTPCEDQNFGENEDYTVKIEESETVPEGPDANFTYDPDDPKEGENVKFTDESTGSDGKIVEWSWDFGDEGTSDEQNPDHIYTEPGSYTVKLTVTDDNDLSDSLDKEIIVEELEGPTAEFDFSPQEPIEDETIDFTDGSSSPDGEIIEWSWDFGDGATSDKQNPSHTYTEHGIYTVELTVTDDNDLSDSVDKEIKVEELDDPIADFSYSPEIPVEDEIVEFTDQSTETDGEIVEWSWSFGDGTTSEEQNPSHTYGEYGIYTVEFTVTDENALSNSTTSEITVEQEEDEEEGEYCIISGDTTFEHITNVKFNGIDRDSGDDGGYADHTDSVSDPVIPGETYELSVTMSTGGYSNYVTVVFDWNQDYDLSNEEVIEVGYGNDDPQTVTTEITVPEDAQAGETRMRVMQRYNGYHYDPCEDQNWGENEDYTVKIEDSETEPEEPYASFIYNPDDPKEDEDVEFTDESIAPDGDIVEWFWDFGDGTTSTVQHPTHIYVDAGTYTVELSVRDDNDLSDSTEKEITVEEKEEDGEYCIISGDTTFEHITNVKFNGIDRDSGDDDGYADHTDSVSDPVIPGETYELSVTMSTGGYSNYVTVVFDWSQDYDLSNEEVIEVGYGNDDPQTVTTEITVPEDAQAGETRMRVMQRYNGYHYDPCEDQNWGENEDYTIKIGEENTQSKQIPSLYPFEMSFLGIFFLSLLWRMPGIRKTQL